MNEMSEIRSKKEERRKRKKGEGRKGRKMKEARRKKKEERRQHSEKRKQEPRRRKQEKKKAKRTRPILIHPNSRSPAPAANYLSSSCSSKKSSVSSVSSLGCCCCCLSESFFKGVGGLGAQSKKRWRIGAGRISRPRVFPEQRSQLLMKPTIQHRDVSRCFLCCCVAFCFALF